jgi:polyhydroxyalkanoate synthase
VGGNIATTEGAVVHRDPILELIQYRPLRTTVSARPILIVPSQISKFYVYDLTAEKRIVRFLLERGFRCSCCPGAIPRRSSASGVARTTAAPSSGRWRRRPRSASRGKSTRWEPAPAAITLAAALGYLAATDALDCVASLTLW